jgi:hypothetical protein
MHAYVFSSQVRNGGRASVPQLEDAEKAFKSEEELDALAKESKMAQMLGTYAFLFLNIPLTKNRIRPESRLVWFLFLKSRLGMDGAGGGSGGGGGGGGSGGGGGGGVGLGGGDSSLGLHVEDFIDMLSNSQSVYDPPEGRLLFFTTNHVSEMPPQLVKLVDQQGMRVLFPNATARMMQRLWELFFADDEGRLVGRHRKMQRNDSRMKAPLAGPEPEPEREHEHEVGAEEALLARACSHAEHVSVLCARFMRNFAASRHFFEERYGQSQFGAAAFQECHFRHTSIQAGIMD